MHASGYHSKDPPEIEVRIPILNQFNIFSFSIMAVKKESFRKIEQELAPSFVTLVAVSKKKPEEEIQELYDLGQRIFGENYVQEMVDKSASLPDDISWHFIGHLQTNKVKHIAPFVALIHSVDSKKLLTEINTQAFKNNRIINCLLQVHIATEESKFGLDSIELDELLSDPQLADLQNISISGFMGMASFSADMNQVRREFKYLKSLYEKYEGAHIKNCDICVLSMGMSNDYQVAIEEGSNLVRIGSLIFGERVDPA